MCRRALTPTDAPDGCKVALGVYIMTRSRKEERFFFLKNLDYCEMEDSSRTLSLAFHQNAYVWVLLYISVVNDIPFILAMRIHK